MVCRRAAGVIRPRPPSSNSAPPSAPSQRALLGPVAASSPEPSVTGAALGVAGLGAVDAPPRLAGAAGLGAGFGAALAAVVGVAFGPGAAGVGAPAGGAGFSAVGAGAGGAAAGAVGTTIGTGPAKPWSGTTSKASGGLVPPGLVS